MKLDPETHYPKITPRQMMICRVITGLFGAAFLIGVIVQLFSGEFRYGIYEWLDGSRGLVRASPGSATVRSIAGKMCAFLSFGMMGAGAVAFAVRPKIFANPAVIWGLTGIILLAFVGLRFAD